MRKLIACTTLWVSLFGLFMVPTQGMQKRPPATAPAVPAAQPQATPKTDSAAKPNLKAATNKRRKMEFGPVQTGPQGTNPQASAAHDAILATLRSQRQHADAEAGQMKLGLRSAAKPAAINASSATAAKTGATQRGGPGALGPSKTMDESGAVHQTAPAPLGPTIICAQDPTMRILTVSGESFPATFTTDAATNFYTITGCSFGDPGPNAKVYIYYQNSFRLDFPNILQWNDNGIQLSLDSNVTGIGDHDNLTLVVQRADGKQATKGGFKFYAARETKPLKYFPRNQFAIWSFTMNDTSHLSPTYDSPSQISTYAADVTWLCDNCIDVKGRSDNVLMQGNQDVWHLGKLQPGFVVQNFGMGYRDQQCGSDGMARQGNWGISMQGPDLRVQWQGQTCVQQCGGQTDCFVGGTSNYFLNVIVTGPRGVDPWTGKPSNN
jgi:hypothetical protein